MTSYTNLTDIPLFRYAMIMADNPRRFETYSGEDGERPAAPLRRLPAGWWILPAAIVGAGLWTFLLWVVLT